MTISVLAALAQTPEPATLSLKMQLESYFQSAKDTNRAKIADSIAKGHKFEKIVAELPRIELWPKTPAPALPWQITLPSGSAVSPMVRVPTDYDTSKALPLILSFPPRSQSADNIVGNLMAEPKIQQLWVAIDKPVGGTFYQPTSATDDLPVLLRELRRKFHVDVDRVILLGEKEGADAAWVAAMMYPHPFAGVIAISGIPRILYPEQSYAILLPNLSGTPFLSIWTDDPQGQAASPVPAVNKAIAEFGLAAGLSFETATLAQNSSGMTQIPQPVIAEATARARHPQSQVQLWFRYLPQGNAGWLRATDLAGDVWTDEQISIAVTASSDRDEFISETLKEKLFSISGQIDGQTITVQTERIAAVELRLSPEQVDFSKSVSIIINGRKRFEGMLEPSVKNLLEAAFEDWDFQHPVYIRKSFSINAK